MPVSQRLEGLVAALAIAVLAPAVAAAPAQGTEPDDNAFIEVDPATVPAGREIQIFADCGEPVSDATVRSRAFDEVKLVPRGNDDNEEDNDDAGDRLLAGSVTVPEDTRAGTYAVNLRCPNAIVDSTDLVVLRMARPTVGPATGGGGTADTGPPDALLLVVGGLAVAAAGGALVLWRGRRAT